MKNDAAFSGASGQISQEALSLAICDSVLALPRARELSQMDVSPERSQAIISSRNILPFRRNVLTPDERERLLTAMAD